MLGMLLGSALLGGGIGALTGGKGGFGKGALIGAGGGLGASFLGGTSALSNLGSLFSGGASGGSGINLAGLFGKDSKSGKDSGLGSIANTFMQLMPSIISDQTQGLTGINESILKLKNERNQIRSSQVQSMMMRRARETMGTARTLLASTGFRPDIGSQTQLGDQSMMNLERNLAMEQLVASSGQLRSDIMQQQIKMKRDITPSKTGKKMFEIFGQPAISKGLKGLSSLFG